MDHVHAKLFLIHVTADMSEWKPIHSNVDKCFKKYEGCISPCDHKRADDEVPRELAKRIQENEL